jgi:outer membrane immunogenic protein
MLALKHGERSVTKIGTALALAVILAPVTAVADGPGSSVFNWTGLYIGAHAGAERTQEHFKSTGGPAGYATGNLASTSWALGAQLGYNYQIGQLVLGAQMDVSWHGGSSRKNINLAPGVTESFGQQGYPLHYGLASWRPRIGWAVDRYMFYGTAGLARGNSRHIEAFTSPAGYERKVGHNNIWGWVAGGGVDYALNQNWSIGAEYLYYNIGRFVLDTPGPVLPASSTKYDNTDHVVTTKLNYRF